MQYPGNTTAYPVLCTYTPSQCHCPSRHSACWISLLLPSLANLYGFHYLPGPPWLTRLISLPRRSVPSCHPQVSRAYLFEHVFKVRLTIHFYGLNPSNTLYPPSGLQEGEEYEDTSLAVEGMRATSGDQREFSLI